MIRKRFSTPWTLIAVALLTGCPDKHMPAAGADPESAPTAAPSPTPNATERAAANLTTDTPFLKVNDTTLTLGDLNRHVQAIIRRQGRRMPPEVLEATRELIHREAYRELIIGVVIPDAARNEGLSMPAAVLDLRERQFYEDAVPEGTDPTAWLESKNVSRDTLRANLEKDFLLRAYKNHFFKLNPPEEPDDAFVAGFYEKNRARLIKPEQRRALRIRYPFPVSETGTAMDEKSQIAQVMNFKSIKDRANKAENAQSIVDAFLASNPTIEKEEVLLTHGTLEPATQAALFATPAGKVTDVVHLKGEDVQMFLIVEHIPQKQFSLEEAAPNLKQQLLRRRIDESWDREIQRLMQEAEMVNLLNDSGQPIGAK